MDKEIVQASPLAVSPRQSIFLDTAAFEHAQRVAKMLATSTMVPKEFKGNIGNIMVALNFANRIDADPFMVMQTISVIHGRPGLEGKLVIALINSSGRFDPVEFAEDEGLTGKGKPDEVGVLAYAKELKSGKVLEGPKVTWELVKGEGWDKNKKYKDGSGEQISKWNTMPQLMFRYRSATFFARTYCPEVLMGMQTKEELIDVAMVSSAENGSYTAANKAKELTEQLTALREKMEGEDEKETEKIDMPPDNVEIRKKANQLKKPSPKEKAEDPAALFRDMGTAKAMLEKVGLPPDDFEVNKELLRLTDILGEASVKKVLDGRDFTQLEPHEKETIINILKAQVDLEAAKA